MTNEELGQAYKAFTAYNLNYKSTRIEEFDPERWIKVVKVILTGRMAKSIRAPRQGSTWTPEQTEKFRATMAAKREAKLNGKQPNSRAGWAKLAEHKP
jgi:hypothetical protein